MTSKALTDRKLQQLRPSEKRQEIADGLLRGLYFIVQPSSAKSWAVRYRIHGKTPVKETLGTWPTMSLKAARETGRDKILAAKAGRDPRAERIAARAKAEAATANTVRNVCEAYLAREASKLHRE